MMGKPEDIFKGMTEPRAQMKSLAMTDFRLCGTILCSCQLVEGF